MTRQFFAVFLKDIQSEIRTRHAVFAMLLFVFNSVILLVFSITGSALSIELTSGILWLLIFFSSSVGMAKSFVSEEERGTSLYLRLVAKPMQVYVGKLLYNVSLSLLISLMSCFLFLAFLDSALVADLLSFALSICIGSVGVAVASTMTSAIIARAQSKGALLPVLSLPLLLPLFFVGIEATTMSMYGSAFRFIMPDLLIMASYCVVLTIVSSWLFEFIWRD